MMHSSVKVQIAPSSVPTTPSWLGEVAVVAHVLTQFGILDAIQQRVQFARARFGHYDTIDFVVVLIGYAVSAEPSLLAFYERLQPFASAFMALFGRKSLPHRGTLSRYLAALDQPTIEALRALFLDAVILRTAQTIPTTPAPPIAEITTCSNAVSTAAEALPLVGPSMPEEFQARWVSMK